MRRRTSQWQLLPEILDALSDALSGPNPLQTSGEMLEEVPDETGNIT